MVSCGAKSCGFAALGAPCEAGLGQHLSQALGSLVCMRISPPFFTTTITIQFERPTVLSTLEQDVVGRARQLTFEIFQVR